MKNKAIILMIKNTKMLLQLETRPISHEQLVIEVKGIYIGLVIIKAKYRRG